MPDDSEHTAAGNTVQPEPFISLPREGDRAADLTMSQAAYRGLAGEVVKTISEHSEADPVALLLHFLTMFGNVVGDGLYVKLGPDRHPGRLFTVVVGDAATGRKGTAGSEIKRLMKEVDRRWYERALVSGMRSSEAIVSVVDDEEGQTNDMVLFYTEFGDLLDTMNRQSSISDVLKEAYDGSALKVRTKNRKGWRTASHANISLMGHVTPTILTERLSDSDIASGLGSRLLLAKVSRFKKISRPDLISDDEVDVLAEKIDDALDWAMDFSFEKQDPISTHLYKYFNSNHLKPKRELPLSNAAWAYWDHLYEKLDSERPEAVRDLLVRAPSNIIRLAVIYAILDKSSVVDKKHLEAAEAVWDYCQDSAIQIFAGITGDYHVDKLLRKMKNSHEKSLTKSEIWAIFSRHHAATWINSVIERLLATELVSEAVVPPAGGRGRPIHVYTLTDTPQPGSEINRENTE